MSLILSDLLILGTALWGQYWKSKADRLTDVIEFMVAEEIVEEETK